MKRPSVGYGGRRGPHCLVLPMAPWPPSPASSSAPHKGRLSSLAQGQGQAPFAEGDRQRWVSPTAQSWGEKPAEGLPPFCTLCWGRGESFHAEHRASSHWLWWNTIAAYDGECCIIFNWFSWSKTGKVKCTGIGCTATLWNLPFLRSSKAIWIWSWATCSNWLCLSSGVGTDDTQKTLLKLAVLWFCLVSYLCTSWHCDK